MWLEYLKAIIFGVLEGVTEWLPISSTGHLILLDEFIRLDTAPELGAVFAEEYFSMFEVVIQLGAILAVAVLYFKKLFPYDKKALSLWGRVLVGCIPAGVAGVFFDKLLEHISGKSIDGWFYDPYVVSAALIVYGILFIAIEKRPRRTRAEAETVYDITYADALKVGAYQALALIPGTSRSGSTILGGRLAGIKKEAAAEFSFFMAIPIMGGAGLVRGAGFFSYVASAGIKVPPRAYIILLVASAVAFFVSLAAIRFLTDFIKRHSFAPFGVYRILLGLLVLGYFFIRTV